MRVGFLSTSPARTIAFVFALNGFIFANWFARIPTVKEELALSDGVLGLALLGTPIGSLVIMSMTGWLVARLGADRVTMWSSALLCLALVGPGLAVDAWTLALALAFLGLTSGAMDIAMNAEGALIERAEGRSILVGFHAMFSLGGAAGALTGGLAAGWLDPLPHLAMAAALGLALLACRRGTLPREQPPKGDAPLWALPHGALLPIAGIVFASMLAEGAAADWSAVYLREVLGTSHGLAAAGFAAFAVAMTVGRLLGDWLGDRWGELNLVRGGALVGGLGLGAALLLGQEWAAILGFGALGLGLAAIVPICFRRAAAAPGFSPGHGLAAVATLGYTGFLAGPPVIGFLAEATGLRVSLGIVALLVLIVGAAASWALPAARPAPDGSEPAPAS